MEEPDVDKQRRTVTKSSIKRKPLANLTNIVRKPYHTYSSSLSQSKKLKSFITASVSPISDSSIGSTPNPVQPGQPIPSRTQRLKPDVSVGDENDIAFTQRQTTQKTRSNTKAATVPFYHTPVKKTRINGKEGVPVPICSSTIEKIKHQGRANQRSTDKTTKDGKISMACHTKTAKNSVASHIPNSTMKIKDKGKEICVQSSYPSMENTNNKVDDITMFCSLMKRKDKGKEIAVPLDHPRTKSIQDAMVDIRMPLSGVEIKDKGKAVMGSSFVNHVKKDEGKAVATLINLRTLEKDKESSCPPVLRKRNDRNGVDGAEDTFKYKSQTDPHPNKKKRRSSKEDVETYALPREFVEQQKAYFKEIDDFELEVEEVSV